MDHQQQPHREGVRFDPECFIGDRNGEEGNNSAAGMSYFPLSLFLLTVKQEQERQLHEAQQHQRQLELEHAAALARQIDEKKEEKRRMRVLDTPDTEFTHDGTMMTNVFAFNEEITCKGHMFHSLVLSNPVAGRFSQRHRNSLLIHLR